ncbi:hypothetical protein FACS1894120_5590 [Clostridia bacterium]|nr:hypothetical protein FACS1894120_5590 [Clostridia bacterium]
MKENTRVHLLDELRGFAIICMVCYHTFFDLRYIFDVPVPIFFEGWFDVIRDVFAGLFIFVSGVCTRYSRSNLRRGVLCFFCGMILTFVTAFAAPDTPIEFGILHFLGVSMMIYGFLCDRGGRGGSVESDESGDSPFTRFLTRHASVIFVAAWVLFLLTKHVQFGYAGLFGFSVRLPDMLYDARLLFPLGFREAGAGFGDYFPVLPWFFCFTAGAAGGVWVKSGVSPLGRIPAFVYRRHLPFFGLCGRYTIWIYMLHQPVVYLVLSAVFGR